MLNVTARAGHTIFRVLQFPDPGGNWPVGVQDHVAERVTFLPPPWHSLCI
jgi:hypothetical protein